MRRIIALIMGAIVALLAFASPATAGGTGGVRCPNVIGTATVNLQCNADGTVTTLSPNAPECIGGYFDAVTMTYANCQTLGTPPLAPQVPNYSQLTISMTRHSIAVDGESDQLASFYHSKSGRTVRFTLRQKATSIFAVYAQVVPTSADGYGEDVLNVRRPAGKTHYKFVAPKGYYVSFIYVEFPGSPEDTSASGIGSTCNQYGCG